ncbi:MAG: hypothetical protein ACM3KM_03535 [Acidobacteriaceae bacterium]
MPQRKGFALFPADKLRETSSKGGKASHLGGTCHEWTSSEAREAGRKGGKAFHQKKAGHRWTREEAAAASAKANAWKYQVWVLCVHCGKSFRLDTRTIPRRG